MDSSSLQSQSNGKARSSDDRVLEVIFNPELPAEEPVVNQEQEEEVWQGEELSEAVREAKRLEVEAVKEAEASRLDQALQLLDQAVAMAPEYPSVYNNRAQVYRLHGDVALALEDLNTALRLCGGRGKVGVQAHCQRGLIHRLQGRCEEAKQDFTAAAMKGNSFAQKQLVQMNPYAALCGQMLSEAFDKLRRGEPDS